MTGGVSKPKNLKPCSKLVYYILYLGITRPGKYLIASFKQQMRAFSDYSRYCILCTAWPKTISNVDFP